MDRSRRDWFIGALAIQLILLCSMGLWKQSMLWRGTDIVLRATPLYEPANFIDNRLALRFNISEFPQSLVVVGDTKDWGFQDVLYVVPERHDGDWTVKQASETRPPNGLYLKGTVFYIQIDKVTKQKIVHMNYGIEHWMLDNNEGVYVQKGPPGSDYVFAATVTITPEGTGLLRHVKTVSVTND